MGCLFRILSVFIDVLLYCFLFCCFLIYSLIKMFIQYIKNKNNRKSKVILQDNSIQKRYRELLSPPPEMHKVVYLKVYINKKFRELKKNDELDLEKLGTSFCDAPSLDFDEDDKKPGFNAFVGEENTSEQFSTLLTKIYHYCGDEFYATIGYEENKFKYKITVKNGVIFINGMNFEHMLNHYNLLKNSIISYSEKLYEMYTYIQDIDYSKVNPYNDIDFYSITYLADKLKNSNDILMFEIPYMEEMDNTIRYMEKKIDAIYQQTYKKTMDSLPDLNIFDESYEEEPIKIKKKKPKEKELSWEEKEFEEEADLWGLSEEDRRIAKEERMSPAEFVEAEEYDDDELLLDEWER